MSNGQRFGGASAAIIAILVSLFVDSWPRNLLLVLGAVAIVGILCEYFWSHRSSSPNTLQKNTQRAGNNSQQIQTNGDVRIDGDMGNTK